MTGTEVEADGEVYVLEEIPPCPSPSLDMLNRDWVELLETCRQVDAKKAERINLFEAWVENELAAQGAIAR